MKAPRFHAGALAALAASACFAQSEITVSDPADAVLRRTDLGGNGVVLPQTTLPDILQVSLCVWQPIAPSLDPYTGNCVQPAANPANNHIMRLDVVLKGLVNPPGTLGFSGQPYDPDQYGPSPLYGFLELDIDDKIDSGGDPDAQARTRYLANVARFGRRPTGPLGWRAAVSEDDFLSGPKDYRRSGGDWVLNFCGCWNATIVQQQVGNANGVFETGETWIVRGRFFQRIGGYACSSGVVGPGGPGAYDPWVHLRFSHNAAVDRTTVSLVYPLTMEGARQLAGLATAPPLNSSASDATSIHEGLQDTIQFAPLAQLPFCEVPAWFAPWIAAGLPATAYLDVTKWAIRGIVGTAYAQPDDTLFAWTDTVFAETPGDMNADGFRNSLDRLMAQQRILLLDGGPRDCDGLLNGSVLLCNTSRNFDLHDLTADGVLSFLDIAWFCPADYNGDGVLTAGDFGAFQTGWVSGDPRADFNNDTFFTVADFGAYQTAFAAGCP